MEYSFITKGHPNIRSKHKTTLEFTMDPEISERADCIVGVASPVSMKDVPKEIIRAIQNNIEIYIILETENATDMIKGYGDPELTLDHPTDMVCRKSTFKCSRTLMINADKAACDLDKQLISDLMNSKDLKVTIKVYPEL